MGSAPTFTINGLTEAPPLKSIETASVVLKFITKFEVSVTTSGVVKAIVHRILLVFAHDVAEVVALCIIRLIAAPLPTFPPSARSPSLESKLPQPESSLT